MDAFFHHTPVLLKEAIAGMNLRADGVYLDGTVGGGGHSEEIARKLHSGYLYCLDKDIEAVLAASAKLKAFENVKIRQGDYKDAGKIMDIREKSLNGVLLDLGVSSHQLDQPRRGFSYIHEGTLDMRLGQTGVTAADLVNTLDWAQLADIFRNFGEERHADLIAKKIVSSRTDNPITTTTRLADIVVSALPSSVRRKEKNPARKTFQALRIAVNEELDTLKEGLANLFALLKGGGRFCVITFHSLEDRIVKEYFSSLQRGCICPPDFPICVCNRVPLAEVITSKPIVAAADEVEQNRRARSAKLRILQKCTP